MISKAKYFLPILFPFLFSSCFLKKKHTQNDSGEDISDVNAHQRPSTMAKEIGKQQKGQQKAYLKQLKRTRREMAKRNKKKMKNIVIKTKTKKSRERKKKKGDSKGNTKEIELK